MNIGQVGGPGGIDRTPDRSEKIVRPKTVGEQPGDVEDRASISSDGKETLATAEALTRKLKSEGQERQAIVEEAKRKLEAGGYDDPKVYRQAAEGILKAEY